MARSSALCLVAIVGCAFNTAGGGAGDETTDGASATDGSTSTSGGDADGDGVTSVATTAATGADSTGVETSTTEADTTEGPATGPATSTTTGGGDSSETGATTGVFDCVDVLYVAGSPMIGPHDQPFFDVLVGLGADVTVVQDDLSTGDDANGVCLVVVSASSTGSDVADKFRDVPVPVVSWEYAIYDDMDMTGDVIDTDFGPAEPEEDTTIVAPGHPLAAGLSGTLTVLAPAPGRMSWGVPAAAAAVVATLPGDETRATLFAYEAGDAMVGLTAPAARVGFAALTSDAGTTINADGEALFAAAVTWAVQ